jgi:hypothetical protein
MKRLAIISLVILIILASCSTDFTIEEAEEYVHSRGVVLTEKQVMEGQGVALEGYEYKVEGAALRILRFKSSSEAKRWVDAMSDLATKFAKERGLEYKPMYVIKHNVVIFPDARDDHEREKEIYEALK